MTHPGRDRADIVAIPAFSTLRIGAGSSAYLRIPRHLDSDSSGNWTAIPRQTGQFNRVASGVSIVLDPVDE